MLTALGAEHLQSHGRIWRERNKYVAHVEFTGEEITAMERLVRSCTNEVMGTQVMFKRFTQAPQPIARPPAASTRRGSGRGLGPKPRSGSTYKQRAYTTRH